jgi:cobalt-zinc-cadmium efflux system protein
MHDHHDHAVRHHAHAGHDHHHGLHHVPAPATFGRAFAIGIGLNLAFTAVEAIFGVFSNSVALLADAGHNLSDVLGLVVAWAATALTRRPPTARYTYGLGASSIFAALFNAVFLLVAVGAIGWEAVQRFAAPKPVAGGTIIAVAAIGILINGVTAWLFASGRKADINIRGAFLHMVADAAVSAGVVLAGLGMRYTGWLWLDPATSLLIAVVIVAGSWRLLRDSVDLSLDAVPAHIDPHAVEAYLAGLPGVLAVHDLHIWGMSTSEAALTVHLVKPDARVDDALLARIREELHSRFGIGHSTVQFELGDASHPCSQQAGGSL